MEALDFFLMDLMRLPRKLNLCSTGTLQTGSLEVKFLKHALLIFYFKLIADDV